MVMKIPVKKIVGNQNSRETRFISFELLGAYQGFRIDDRFITVVLPECYPSSY